jgi:hypothetical protein
MSIGGTISQGIHRKNMFRILIDGRKNSWDIAHVEQHTRRTQQMINVKGTRIICEFNHDDDRVDVVADIISWILNREDQNKEIDGVGGDYVGCVTVTTQGEGHINVLYHDVTSGDVTREVAFSNDDDLTEIVITLEGCKGISRKNVEAMIEDAYKVIVNAYNAR